MSSSESRKKKIDRIVRALMKTYADGRAINQVEGLDLPKHDIILRCLEQLHAIVFPGFGGDRTVTYSNIEYHIGDIVNHIQSNLTREVVRAFSYNCKVGNCKYCQSRRCRSCDIDELAEDAVIHLLQTLPRIREILKLDVAAGFAGDPAAASHDEIIIAYPYVFAVTTHRLAHELHLKEVPLIPRLWSEHAHALTGIDIHPGAQIGPSFFIDHGTGVVIGETTVIGKHVQVYQGVTLGALNPAQGQSLRGKRRHPTIEDDVVIYAGATILGGKTVIGKGAVIGGNVWITDSVPAGTKVLLSKNDPVYILPRGKGLSGK